MSWEKDKAKYLFKEVTDSFLLAGIEAALKEARERALDEAIKSAAGPDEGYLHGCDCHGRIRALKSPPQGE